MANLAKFWEKLVNISGAKSLRQPERERSERQRLERERSERRREERERSERRRVERGAERAPKKNMARSEERSERRLPERSERREFPERTTSGMCIELSRDFGSNLKTN